MSAQQQPESHTAERVTPSDPSKIPAFDRAMRGLIQVPKAELDARIKREAQHKRPKKKG